MLVQDLLGLGEDSPDVGAIARELGIAADGRAALVGFRAEGAAVPANVIALSASAFRADAQVASTGERVYVLLPKIGATSSLTSWVRGMVAALRRELGLTMRAVIAAPLTGLAGAAAARAEVDRVFDSADRHPGAIGQVTSLDEAHTTVLLDEIVAHVAGRQRLVDPRVRELREQDPMLADTLAAYLDGFGDIAAVAQRLHVHPNTVRYRLRRIEKLLSTSLDDPDDRLVLALGLRATERVPVTMTREFRRYTPVATKNTPVTPSPIVKICRLRARNQLWSSQTTASVFASAPRYMTSGISTTANAPTVNMTAALS